LIEVRNWAVADNVNNGSETETLDKSDTRTKRNARYEHVVDAISGCLTT